MHLNPTLQLFLKMLYDFEHDYTELPWSEQYTKNKLSFQSLLEHFL
jgi:hypothetical protein